MVAPVITFYDSTDATNYLAYSYGSWERGQTSTAVVIDVWNDKGGGAGSDTAQNVTITTTTEAGALSGTDIIDDTWYEVECTSFGDVAYTPVGGATTKAIGYAAADDTIPTNQKAIVSTQINIPAAATGGLRSFRMRVAYDY